MTRSLIALRLSLTEALRGPLWLLALGALGLAALMVAVLPGETGPERAALGASVTLFIVRAAAGLGVALLFAGGLAQDLEERVLAPVLAAGLARWELLLSRLGAAALAAAALSFLLHAAAALLLQLVYGADLGDIARPKRSLEATRFTRSEARPGEPSGWVRGGGFARWRFELAPDALARGPLPLRYAFEAWSGVAASPTAPIARRADFASCGYELRALDGEGHLIARRARGVLAGRATMNEEEVPERFASAAAIELTLEPAGSACMLRADPAAVRLVAGGRGGLLSNLMRSALLTALAGAVCAAIAILSGALFPSALAVMFALVIIIGGLARPQISVLAAAPAPVSAVDRSTPSPLGEEAPRGPGPLVRMYLKGIAALLPELSEYDGGAVIMRGETLSLSRARRGAPGSLLTIALAFALSALALRRRELAA